MISLGEWAAQLKAAAAACRPELEATLLVEMVRMGQEAAEMPGKEQGHWPPLAAATLYEKARLGYEIPAPLLRTGVLKGSIRGEVSGLEGAIGSTDVKAVYHEFGTSRMPPRPIYSYTMQKNLPQLETAFGLLAMRLLGGRP